MGVLFTKVISPNSRPPLLSRGVDASVSPIGSGCRQSRYDASRERCTGVTAWNCLQGPVPVKGGDIVVVQGTGGVSV